MKKTRPEWGRTWAGSSPTFWAYFLPGTDRARSRAAFAVRRATGESRLEKYTYGYYYSHVVRPLKRAGRGYLFRPLDTVFGAPSNVAILRALVGSASGLTGRQVAKAAGIAPRAALQGLERLGRARLVRRLPVGKAFLFSLDRELPLLREAILPLLEFERGLRSRALDLVRDLFRGQAVSVSVFGSAARNEDRPESDFDLCVVVEGEAERKAIQKIVDSAVDALGWEGILASPMIVTVRELREGYHAKHPFYRKVVRDAESVVGHALAEVAG